MKINTTVQWVEVKSNSLRAEGMIAIVEALKVNSTLTKIDVSDNQIGVRASVSKNRRLQIYLFKTQVNSQFS